MLGRGRSRHTVAAIRRAWLGRRAPVADVVAGVSEPGPCPATLALRGERMPPLELSGPACQDVLEPPERSSPGDGDLQPVSAAGITHRPDEQLHVPVAVPRTLAVRPQPLIRIVRFVLILLADLPRIVDGRRRPDLTGHQVDAPASVHRVAFEGAGQLIQIHMKSAEIRYHAVSQHLRVPKTCATWAKALVSAVERSACAGPVVARPEVG